MRKVDFSKLAEEDLIVREDRHPIIFILGRHIAEILIKAGYNTQDSVNEFLNTEFPFR